MFHRRFFLPTEHGAWIWWIGPMVIGLTAAGRVPGSIGLLIAAALAAFLLRQPASIAVKALAGRRPRSDLPPALLWATAYGLALAVSGAGLVGLGHARILVLGVPGTAVFGWHLWLISRRGERGQLGVELVGAGVLALAAPAAYWVAGGPETLLPWILWSLCWIQSAASIVLVYHRLEQRRLPGLTPPRQRLRRAWRPIAYHAFNLAASGLLAAMGAIPWSFAAGFGLMAADLTLGLARPPIGARPAQIGLRQLAASTLFIAISAAGFLL